MAWVKRIFLFAAVNLLVIFTVTLIINFFQIQPYLNTFGLDYRALMSFCLVWGMTGAVISLLLSRVMVKWMMGVKVVDPQTMDPTLNNLVSTVETLCNRAGLTMPEIGIYQSHEVNAFATGPTKKRSLVAVSSGLLNRMNQAELEGVLAHEISHIENGDMVTMTILQGVVNAFVMFLARAFAWALSGLGNKDRNGRSSGGSYLSYHLFTYLFEAIFMALGFLVIAAFSRFREFRADAGGANLAGKDAMIAALRSLQSLKQENELKEHQAIAALKFYRYQKRGLKALFATHPPLEERIQRLELYAYS